MAANNDSSANMITVIVRSPKESKDIAINGRETVKQVKRTCVVITDLAVAAGMTKHRTGRTRAYSI